ncbi:unnamed protein product [Periconia digitata]|uniref:Opioid growth factor receptor (OGFr) conserved domain-containing protein n=1 Tax=Periconia digitata TaxID=1303443 RepID=A0A9W4UIG2_9PLEO|nr:unnamed protein product [Periconia digitata]
MASSLRPRIVSFYDPDTAGTDSRDRKLQDILGWSDLELERSHDYIQWLFPLPEGSVFNYNAPIIDQEVMEAFRGQQNLQQGLRLSFRRIIQFYGFTISEEEAAPVITPLLGNQNDTTSAAQPDLSTPPEATSSSSFPSESSVYRVVRGDNWGLAHRNWTAPMNHNHLRISRILRSLRVLGLQRECTAFYTALKEAFDYPETRIGAKSMMFWTRATELPLWIAPDGEKVAWLKNWEEKNA